MAQFKTGRQNKDDFFWFLIKDNKVDDLVYRDKDATGGVIGFHMWLVTNFLKQD